LQKLGREVGGRIVLLALGMCKLGKQLGLFEGLLTGGLAFGPQGAELSHILLKGAVDALLIERQELEIFAFVDPGAGAGEGFLYGKLGGSSRSDVARAPRWPRWPMVKMPVSMARARLDWLTSSTGFCGCTGSMPASC
jgi:hypothetical protein